MDAIKRKHPNFVMTGMNEFQMARIKEAPKGWHLLEGLTTVWTVLMLALLVVAVQSIGSYVSTRPASQGSDRLEV